MKYHFIGINGIGMSALARFCLQKNYRVTGSDMHLKQELIDMGAVVTTPHNKANVEPNSVVVYSSAIDKNNEELLQAKNLCCSIMHRSELLSQLASSYKILASLGTHGKTTVSALLAWTLLQAGRNPAYALGGMLKQENTNACHSTGEFFVLEADESDGSHLNYHPFGAIITNLEAEHLDNYASYQALQDSFLQFTKQISSLDHVFWCRDSESLAALKLPGYSYGFSSHADLVITDYVCKHLPSYFSIRFKENTYTQIPLAMLGRHNIENAAAVFGLCLNLGLEEEVIKKAFTTFPGVMRRQDILGESKAVTFIDDYAHHPTEIRATLAAIRNYAEERRVIAVLEPHRFSRVAQLCDEFALSCDDADEVWVTDIYAASERPIAGISHNSIIEKMQQRGIAVYYVPLASLEDHCVVHLCPHDVVIGLGAGAIAQKMHAALHHYQSCDTKKLEVAVIAGGQSEEHEVSITSARFFLTNLDKSLYTTTSLGITREGNWHMGEAVFSSVDICTGEALNDVMLKQLQKADAVIPILHGPFGEDGVVQGFLEMLQLPYVGPNWKSAALCMNKAVSKLIWQFHKLPIANFTTFSQMEFEQERHAIYRSIFSMLSYPMFVKPVHYGSSIGVSEVNTQKELEMAIEMVFQVDTHCLVEDKIIGRELEVGVVGTNSIVVAHPGEVKSSERFYDYAAKYSKTPITKIVKADISDKELGLIKTTVYQAYKALMCSGMARVDLFLTSDGRICLNEINPLPGCAPASLFPRVWNNEGWTAKQLVDRLIISALYSHRQNKKRRHIGHRAVENIINQHAQKQ